MGTNKFTYICKICDFESNDVREHLKHLNTKKHKSKRELEYMRLKFEKKMNESEIEELLIEMENSD
jgi:hypothetical protein